MSNVRTRNEIEAVIKKVQLDNSFYVNLLPTFAAFLSGRSLTYLCNGIGSTSGLVGGTGYTSSTFVVPLLATSPGGSVNAVVSFTNTAGVLSAPVITVPGSGYFTSPLTFTPNDTTGVGASVVLTPANQDQAYNYTPSQAFFLQQFLGADYAAIGMALAGTEGSTSAASVAVNAAGSGYAVGDYLVPNQAGLHGLILQVATLSGSGVATVTIQNGGAGAAVASGLTTNTNGAGSGCTINIITLGMYNYTANTNAWIGWGF